MPPYLAGRDGEEREFRRLLTQDTIPENMILTGLRGAGKTVLLETFKPIAVEEGWLWAGTDLSESASISEKRFAARLLTALAIVTSSIVSEVRELPLWGFSKGTEQVVKTLEFSALADIYDKAVI